MFLDENCTCFVRDGKTYCKKDYVRLFGAKCDKCGHQFGKNDYVMRAKNRIFHLECFRCVACEHQLIPGDSFALRDDGLFCNQHHRIDKDEVGSETNNNKSMMVNNNSNNSEDGDDKSEEGKLFGFISLGILQITGLNFELITQRLLPLLLYSWKII